jgi:hypothetical protein
VQGIARTDPTQVGRTRKLTQHRSDTREIRQRTSTQTDPAQVGRTRKLTQHILKKKSKNFGNCPEEGPADSYILKLIRGIGAMA